MVLDLIRRRALPDLNDKGLASIPHFLSLQEIDHVAQVVYAIYDKLVREIDTAHETLRSNYFSWHGVAMSPLQEFLRDDAKLAEGYDHLLTLITQRVSETLGPEWKLSIDRSFFRRHIGTAKHIVWHIDADAAVLFSIEAQRWVNVWVPCEEVGYELPSIELVPRSNATMRTLPVETRPEYASREDAFVRTVGSSIIPVLHRGDALLFDDYTLHRTQPMGSHGTRTSCEFRFRV